MRVKRRIVSSAVVALAAALDACGGGGGSPTPVSSAGQMSTSAPTPTNTPTTSSAPLESPTPTATPTASPTPATISASGSIVNHDTNAALSGAVAYVSHTLVSGATPPATVPADGAVATTDASGHFSMTLPAQSSYPARFYIEAFGTSSMSVAHEILTVTGNGAQTVPTIGLTTLSSDEASWLSLVNQDRASYGQPALVTDETTQEQARLWLGWIAQNHFEHDCSSSDLNCPSKTEFTASEHADFSTSGENIGYGYQSYQAQEQSFMAESANCPQPAMYSTCPYAENTGHFLNIIAPQDAWYGSAYTLNGAPYNGTSTTQYFDQEFSDASIAGNQVNIKTFKTIVPIR